jgi:hypothetical protein
MDRNYHYRKAEQCAEWAHQLLLTGEGSQDAAVWAAIAQAHATLAHTATTGTSTDTARQKAADDTRRLADLLPREIETAMNKPPPRQPRTEASWQPPVSPPQIRPLSRRPPPASFT